MSLVKGRISKAVVKGDLIVFSWIGSANVPRPDFVLIELFRAGQGGWEILRIWKDNCGVPDSQYCSVHLRAWIKFGTLRTIKLNLDCVYRWYGSDEACTATATTTITPVH
jgi:hypothetical protein